MATTVEVITSPHCIESPKALRLVQRMASKIDGVYFYKISTITESGRQYAENLAVENTPAIVIDGHVALVGHVTRAKIETLLCANLAKH